MEVKAFFDGHTNTLTYIVYQDKDAVIIDPVWNYDQGSSTLKTSSVDQVLDFLKENSLTAHFVLETHAHADHITGAQLLKNKIPGLKVGIGKNITKVQARFKEIFNLVALKTDGSQFDLLLEDEQTIEAGSISIKTIFTPGHTPACCSFLIGENLFTGDALFMPDFGTGRCDFPDGSAEELFISVHEKIYALNEDIITYTGHDYMPGGRELRYQASIKEQKQTNTHIKSSTTKAEYIDFREGRDQQLSAPKLLLPSIQVNIDAGRLPIAEENDCSYLKIPISF